MNNDDDDNIIIYKQLGFVVYLLQFVQSLHHRFSFGYGWNSS